MICCQRSILVYKKSISAPIVVGVLDDYSLIPKKNGLYRVRYWDNRRYLTHSSPQVLESSGRLPTGLLSGTITNFGDYDQCLSTSGQIDDSIAVYGQYCFLNIRADLPPVGHAVELNGSAYEKSWVNQRIARFARMYGRIANGVCIPSTCAKEEVTDFLRNGIVIRSCIQFWSFCSFSSLQWSSVYFDCRTLFSVEYEDKTRLGATHLDVNFILSVT